MIIGGAHRLAKSAPGFKVQAYIACSIVRCRVEITADTSPSAAMKARQRKNSEHRVFVTVMVTFGRRWCLRVGSW